MPIIELPSDSFSYYLLSLSAKGDEVREADGTLLSEELTSRLSQSTTPAVTDVFLVCHGWNTSAVAANDMYRKWMHAMAADSGGLEEAKAARGGAFTPLLVGLRWPSKFLGAGGDRPPIVNVVATATKAARRNAASDVPAADAEAGVLGGGGDGGGGGGGGAAADAAAVDATVAVLLAALEEEDAQLVRADTAAMGAFTTLARAMVTSEGSAPVLDAARAVAGEQGGRGEGGGGRAGLPQSVLDALEAVQRALSPTGDDADGGGGALEGVGVDAHGNGGGAAQPGPPWSEDDAKAANAAFLQAAKDAANVEISRGVLAWTKPVRIVMLPIVEVVFASFARRAAALGRGPVAELLSKFRVAAAERGGGAVHFHGVGHSLGAHLLLAAAVSPSSTSSGVSSSSKRDTLRREKALQSLSLLQGAVPATALHAPGAYEGAHKVVDGPIVVTRSAHDRALKVYRVWYGPPLGLEGCTQPPDLQPRADPVPHERVMVAGGGGAGGGVAEGAVRQDYELPGGEAVVNVDAAAVINQVDGWWDVSGAHSDIVHVEVVHLVWQAILATLW